MTKREQKNETSPLPADSDDLALENLMSDYDMTAADAQDFGRVP